MPRSSICLFCRRSLETRRISSSRSLGFSSRYASTTASRSESKTADSYQGEPILSLRPRHASSNHPPSKNRKNRVQPRHDEQTVSAAERIRIALGQSSKQLFPVQSRLESSPLRRDADFETPGEDGVFDEEIREGKSRQGIVRFNKTASRLGNVHNLDDLLREIHVALQSYTGLYELRHSVLALSKAIARCRRQHSASDVHSAFNMIKVALLSRGFPIVELLPIELSCVESTGSISALTQILQATKGVPGVKLLPSQIKSMFDLLVNHGTSKMPTKWDGIRVAGWRRRQSTELLFGPPLTDLGTSAELRSLSKAPSKARSLRSFISDKNVELLCDYIRALGKLNANHEIWSEWRTSRYRVVPWKPDPKALVGDQEDSQQLLLAFIDAFISCRDLRSVWVLMERVKQRNPSAITPEVWAAILKYRDENRPVTVSTKIGASSSLKPGPGLLNEVMTRLVEDGQGNLLGNLAKSGSLSNPRKSASNNDTVTGKEIWQAWADGLSTVLSRSTEDCLPVVEQTLRRYRA